MIEIREVKSRKDIKTFIEWPVKVLYKDNPYFVPPLYMDEKKMFKPNYVYKDQSEYISFLAFKDGKVAGRIQAINQQVANQKWNEKKVRFTRFDSIDDQEVANALFDECCKWAKEKGLDTIVGPLGFSDLEREGLLVEGFDQLSTFEEQYNYPYYQKLVENYGFVKEVGWTERQLRAPEVVDEKLERLSSLMMRRYHLHFGESKNAKDFIKKYGDAFFEILDETYEDIYGTVPFTKAMKKMMIDNFKLIIDTRFVAVILDENNKVVCFGLCFPSIAKAAQKAKGHLYLHHLPTFLKAIKHPKVIDLGLIGVLPEYKMRGIASAIIHQTMLMLQNPEIEYAETNLNLEDNNSIQNQWKSFDNVLHKRRYAYKKTIE